MNLKQSSHKQIVINATLTSALQYYQGYFFLLA